MGIVASPILLWGVLLGGEPKVYRRRLILYVLCMYLVFLSHARAGIASALISSALLCLVVRKYKLLVEGTIVLVIALSIVGLFRPEAISSLTSSIVYKNKEGGLLVSRISPWQSAISNIQEHPWFGMGLGTTASGTDPDEGHGQFSSVGTVTTEHGSSYLAILAGVGVLGAIPFALLLFLLISRIVRTALLSRASGNAAHPALVLAIVMVAGILHATFEDWMFAPGNYLCVFFWSLAFLLNDFAPASKQYVFAWNSSYANGAVGHVASSS